MSDKKNRLAEQSKEDRLDQNGALPESDIGNTSAHGKEEDLPSPTELLNDLLAGLEGGMHSSEQVVQQPAPATAEQSGDQPVLDAVEADTDNQAEEQMPGQAEIIEETDESEPVAEHISTAPEAEADESEFEADDAEENAAIKPVTETALTVSPNGTNGTEGMTLMERAQYHARMRRREQTRLRRESAKRGASGAEIPYQAMTPMDMRFTLIRLAIAAIFLIFGVFLRQTAIGFIFYLIAYLITVLPIVVKVAHNFTHGKYFDEYLLIFIASLGAFLLGNRPEASVVLILHGVGKIASDLVLASTHKSLTKQTGFIPEHASVVNMQGEERQVSPNEIKIGDFVLVRSGERVPIDGIVLRGEGTVDDTVLTGDNEPVQISKNAKVLAGSLYTGSLLLLRAVARFDDCAFNQIMRVQEEGKERKAALEDSVAHGAARIIPVIIVLAILLSIIPPLFNSGTSMANWIYRALTILVVCCPTALSVSVPLCFLCGSGRLMQKGIHVKGSEAIEKMAELRMVVFDKTGTLTEGNLRVKEIHGTQDFNQESCLALAAAAEQFSQHPVARAVVAAYPSVPQKISEFEEFPGRGVRARIGNRNLLAGNRRLMVSRGVKGVPDIPGTVVYIAYEGEYAGAIVLEDTVRPEAADAIKELKNQGVLRTVILTGDTELPTHQAAEAIGIDTTHFGLQPEEKASKMEFLMRTIPTDGTAAYVGDGVNDIEELKMADVGIAMGVAGSQQSASATNILVMSNDLTRLSDTLRICRRTHSIALQNMVVVILVKILLALLTLVGVAYMWQAVAADVLLAVLTVLNAARILGIK
ncbi:heavy metal translocating P-type ATPase [Agathobaculum sp. Marseille-P7918]|uniref:heavy metal translocating P-type ATPase n=1 Tax=Agathobaculum sp. Marseille-P7918 TaxID=2479843 RepID=UPI00356894DC